MWHNGCSGEIALQCPRCGGLYWRTPAELKDGRLFCFGCVRLSAWSAGAGPTQGGAGGRG